MRVGTMNKNRFIHLDKSDWVGTLSDRIVDIFETLLSDHLREKEEQRKSTGLGKDSMHPLDQINSDLL